MESKRPTLLKVCWLINNQLKAETAYQKALWNTSYYRKLKTKLENSSNTNEKWNDHTELSKKIEYCRIAALKKQEQLLKLNKHQQPRISAALKSINGILKRCDSRVTGLTIVQKSSSSYNDLTYTNYNVDQIAEMADQYEADKALNKVLTT